MSEEMMKRIISYWTHRADSYSKLNREEFGWGMNDRWLAALESEFPDKPREEIRVLDIGTGPGFFSILLSQAGYFPHAADCTEEMLKEARKNAGIYEERITFGQMNADALQYEDETFDIVVNRNLTWNLQNPCRCYEEWKRVLKPEGKLIVFDANWYHYLFDEAAKEAYDRDREAAAREAIIDFNTGDQFEVMEEIAMELPMSKKPRPIWDREKLLSLGYASVDICEDIWKAVWTDAERINYASTPMFRIVATK
ncbi:MAG: class I SAM-dependent methyltransferase [Lachnospiraceae bacterium]|nr:class I SAM-dependent methyltransferase [Lachnospiraceae bacterium]